MPVQVEAYPDHEDFAVRTMGMPGLGALGVTFNNGSGDRFAQRGRSAARARVVPLGHHFVARNEPRVRALHDQHRVPRWFTEGLAVYEETAINPDWGDRLDHPSIMAIKEKKLLPMAELDRGYIHPSYPEQVIVSYYQGGRTHHLHRARSGATTQC